jgi:hypothetical protein
LSLHVHANDMSTAISAASDGQQRRLADALRLNLGDTSLLRKEGYKSVAKRGKDSNTAVMSQAVNTTLTSPADTSSSADWILDYVMVLQSLLGTVMNIIKNIMSTRRALQLSWNNTKKLGPLDRIYLVDQAGVLVSKSVVPQAQADGYASSSLCCGVKKASRIGSKDSSAEETMRDTSLLRKVLRIHQVKSVALDEICEGTVEFLSFLNELVSLNQSEVDGMHTLALVPQMRVQYPVCATVEIIRSASLEIDAPSLSQTELCIKFIYVLELSGLKRSTEKMEYGIFSKPTYEIREYYSTDNGWLANEEDNLCVARHRSAVNVHKKMLEFSFIRLFHSNATKENIISHYQELCLNTLAPGTRRSRQSLLCCYYLQLSLVYVDVI